MTAIGLRNGHDPDIETASLDRELLAAMAVHELREPVHAVQSFLSVVLQERAGPLSPSQADLLSTAYQAALRMIRRIEDLRLVFTDQYQLALRRQNIDLLERIRNCTQELGALGEIHGVKIHITEHSNRPFNSTYWADPERVDQVLLNLLENAIKYSSPNSSIHVSVHDMESGAKAVVVQSTSRLDALTTPDKWLDPFWQGEVGHASKPHGMGIGLAVVEHLVRAHGGVVQTFATGHRVYVGFILPPRTESCMSS